MKNHTPLQGLYILNTRPAHQALDFNQSLKSLGAEVINCPALKIVPITDAWEKHAPAPSSFDLIIFISTNAVNYFFERISPQNWPTSIITLAIGAATASALLEKQITARQPEDSHTEGLLRMACFQQIREKKILIIKGTGGRALLQTDLINKGAHVETLDVYTRTMPDLSPQFIQQIWRDNMIDIILFTSQQGMQQVFALFGQTAQTWLQSKPSLVISQRLAGIARQMGIKKIFIANPNQLQQGLIDAYEILKLEKQGTET